MLARIWVILIIITYVKSLENNHGREVLNKPFTNRLSSSRIERISKREAINTLQSDIPIDNAAKVEVPNVHQVNLSLPQDNQKPKQNVLKQMEGETVKTSSIATSPKTKDNAPVTIQTSTTKSHMIKGGSISNSTVEDNKSKNISKVLTDFMKTTEATSTLPISNPGVVKRGLIVFGGFTILAVAYFIFHRGKGKNYDSNNTHNSNDTNQFRYGVLQSDERRDNLELSRIPLTMESDEDDEEDLEIFDLEQNKKSMSYVNLQTNDEDIVFSNSNESKNNLLLDIEEGPSDMINWSSNGNKSIL